MDDVSFIIPSYNSFLTIEKTVRSVLKQSAGNRVREVIVVDSSDDGQTRSYLDGFANPLLKVIRLENKTSPAEGRNIGARASSGKLLCFVDSDVYLSDNWLENVLNVYDHGCLVGCGSVSVPPFQDNNRLALAQLYLQFNESLDTGVTRAVAMVPACNMFVQRELFDKAGGFPAMRASEDVVLCLNLGKLTQVWFVPRARCFHIFREETRAYFNNQIVLGKYIIIYRRATYGRWFYKGLWPLVFLPGFLLIKIARIKLRIFKAGGGHFKKFVLSSPLFVVGIYYWAVGFVQGCFSREGS